MVRYRVVVTNAHENRVKIPFNDLLVKYSTGYLIALEVMEGEYVPVEILDPLDVRKSFLVGSLGRYIKAGKVIEENDEIIAPKVQEIPKPIKEEVKEVPKEEPKQEEKAPKEVALVSPIEEPLRDISQVKKIEDFLKLSFFLKVSFIKKCNDPKFLQEILAKVDESKEPSQLRNNINMRLSEL